MAQPVRAPQGKKASTPAIQIASPDYGLSLVDPITGVVYTHEPQPVTQPSAWVDTYLALGVLKRVDHAVAG